MPRWTAWFQPVAGGLLVGLVGWFLPEVLGVGYGYVGQALNGKMVLRVMALLVFLKLLTVAVSYASGNAGGIFGPSLFIGAMLGGSVGAVAHSLLPAYTASPGAYALVGMGAAFAGIVRAPMTSVVMIFEVTRDYAIIVPLMISNLVSYFISHRLQREPIYGVLALQDGIHLPSTETRERQRALLIRHAMRTTAEVFSARWTVAEALERANRSEYRAWPVADERGLVGLISRDWLGRAMAEKQGAKQLAELLDVHSFPHVHADQPLNFALLRMGAARFDVLPVVSRANLRELEGIITLSDVLKCYGLDRP
jgi:CIC family chloride channel protein